MTRLLLVGLGVVLRAALAGAVTITVNSNDDPGGLSCTLRDAILAANSDAPSGACPAGAGDDVVDLTNRSGTILLASALPTLASNIHVRGPGPSVLTVDGQDTVPVFVATGATVSITDVAIARGLGDRGGGVRSLDGATLTLARVVVRNCRAFNGGGVANDSGGLMTIEDSTIRDNQTTGNAGAGIVNNDSTLVLRNTTISGNTTTGADRSGAGLIQAAGSTTITNCTFANNVGTSAEGWAIANILNDEPPIGTLRIANSIIANSSGHNCLGPIVSDGHNIADDASCGLTAPGDFGDPGVVIGLAALADNGGPTPTHALIGGGGAVDSGDPALCPPTDQRGIERPVDGDRDGRVGCDRGAFELGCGDVPSGTLCASDGNLCTDDACTADGLCEHSSRTGSCNDGNPCTVEDVCSDGTCVAGTPTICPLTGHLTYASCLTGETETGPAGTNACTAIPGATTLGAGSGLDNLRAIAESADGRSLYVVSGFDDAIARFDRDPASGALTYQGCVSGETGSACTLAASATPAGANSGLDLLEALVVSADGKSVYTASFADDAVAHFERDPGSGALTFRGCFTGETESASACIAIGSARPSGADSGFDGLHALALSPDGRSLYAAASFDDAVVSFDRNPGTGALAYRGCLTGESQSSPGGTNACAAIPTAAPSGNESGLDFPFALALSPDGASLYVTAPGDDAVVRFDRDAASGALTYRACITGERDAGAMGTNACSEIRSVSPSGSDSGLDDPWSLAVSADGRSLYAVALSDNAVVRFDRDPATGALTYQGCITGDLFTGPATPAPGSGACIEIPGASTGAVNSGLNDPVGLALSADGRSLYTVTLSDDAIAHFVRDPATGALAYDRCLTGETESGPARTSACSAIGGATPLGVNSGFDNLQAVLVSADGRSVYAVSGEDVYTNASADASIVRLAREAVVAATPIRGDQLLIRDTGATKRRIVFVSRDRSIAAGAESGFDPAAAGAVFQVFNDAGTGDSACMSLVAGGWSARGKANKRTLRYKDRAFVNGPCSVASVKHGKLLKVACQAKRQPIGYSLDEPAQQRVAVSLRSGASEYCAVFGGTVSKDRRSKTFRAKKAAAPAACATRPPCP